MLRKLLSGVFFQQEANRYSVSEQVEPKLPDLIPFNHPDSHCATERIRELERKRSREKKRKQRRIKEEEEDRRLEDELQNQRTRQLENRVKRLFQSNEIISNNIGFI